MLFNLKDYEMSNDAIVYYDTNMDQLIVLESDIEAVIQLVVSIIRSEDLCYIGTLNKEPENG